MFVPEWVLTLIFGSIAGLAAMACCRAYRAGHDDGHGEGWTDGYRVGNQDGRDEATILAARKARGDDTPIRVHHDGGFLRPGLVPPESAPDGDCW